MVVALGGKSSESFPGLTRILPLYEEANELEASFQTQTFHLFLPKTDSSSTWNLEQ